MSIDGVSTRREEARADRAAQAEQRRADDAARRAEEREDRRLAFDQEQAAAREKQQKRDKRRDERKKSRARLAKAAVARAREHALDLLFVPVILVPAILAWSAMAAYGRQVFGPVGMLLPLFSEAAMWAFAFAVTLGAGRGEPTGALKVGVWVFAAVAAGLNFLHGYSTGNHWDTGVVMAVVSIGGVSVHQLITARPSAARARIRNSAAVSDPAVQPEAVQPVPDAAPVVQPDPVQPPALDASSAAAASERTTPEPESVQPGAGEAPAEAKEKPERSAAVPASPKKDRARADARLHEFHTGRLPTVDELMKISEVSRGTAGTALQELRQQPAPLQLITEHRTHEATS
ncbi:hypothetical protein [Amycolatopsis panacis]|uniref:DUF2637 domain-containing protein n=1 Tax=Amycolatopsis panacis TaxID=2340917 RepID=A0A419IBK1_9PSEU|nr:hypothetical protein [Amycolatopsis panacis]RJQ92383.1 hypothetical protein D5S19_01060 [Amycolatopsis panacis]